MKLHEIEWCTRGHNGGTNCAAADATTTTTTTTTTAAAAASCEKCTVSSIILNEKGVLAVIYMKRNDTGKVVQLLGLSTQS